MTSTAEIHERLAAKGLLPAEHFVDSAYVDAGLLGIPKKHSRWRGSLLQDVSE